MAKKIVTIDLPLDDMDEFLDLADSIVEKHEEDDVSSPLNEFDMAGFTTKKNSARTLRKDATTLHGDGERLMNEANVLIGIAKGQSAKTEGTVYNVITLARDRLLITHRNNPESLNQWGYDVVISQSGGKTTVKVNLPRHEADDMLGLADSIFTKHTADGAGSPLNMFDMAAFETRKNDGRTNRNNAKNAHALAEEKNQEAEVIIGLAEGQNKDTPGTLYNALLPIRDLLQLIHRQNEERLNKWGFKVKIGEAKSPTAKHAKSLTITVKSAAEGNPAIEGATITPPEGNPAQTDENGQITVPSPLLGTATFTVSAAGHVEQEVTYEIKAGDNVVEVILEVAE